MNFPQKRSVNVAAVNKRKHNLSHMHLGTIDFGRIKPILCNYMVPGDEFAINVANETRVNNPMPSPTIGEFDVVYRHFFVPISHVWHPFYDFIKNQQTIYNGAAVNITSAPYIHLKLVVNYFKDVNNGLCEIVNNPTSHSEWDFENTNGTASVVYYKFTRKGRIYNDFLTSLGINIPYGADVHTTEIGNTPLYIIIPLVCFWKFYFDWIVPSRFIRDHQDYIQLFIDRVHSSQVGQSSVPADIFFTYLLHEPLAYYEDDFFTTLTEFPFSEPDQMQDDVIISNPDKSLGDWVGVNASHTPILSGSEGSSVSLQSDYYMNMYTLQTLGKLQDLLNRNLIAGTKVQDWLLTEFGLKPNNDALHLSSYLGSKRTTLNVRDVISNADTQASGGVALGSYAGYIKDGHRFDFGYKATEHGFYFITYELIPKTSYYQGLAAQFDMGDRFDFFQPEFDNQQGEPVPFRRLFFSQDNHSSLQRFDAKFGFGLQYGDLKFSPDVISGDFRTRFGLSLKSWYLARDVSYLEDSTIGIDGIDEDFCLVNSKYQDWHYIFSNVHDDLDPFIVAFYFNIPAMRPMKSVVEGFEPTYQQSGKDVKLDFSGSVK